MKFGARAIITGGLLVSLVLLSFLVWKGKQKVDKSTLPISRLLPLPTDVDGIVTGYIYRDTADGCTMEIRGSRVVRRGRKILGLRTNLVKMGYFEDISGDIRSKKGSFRFAAERAEWAMTGNTPIVLLDNICLTVNGKKISGVRKVNIYPLNGIMEVHADRVQHIRFR